MEERDALLAAILATPDIDTPRLAFADWLQEHGDDARAEFIRVQVAIAQTPKDDPELASLHKRQWELLSPNRMVWLGEWILAHEKGWVFRRGFLDSLNLGHNKFGDTGVSVLVGFSHLVTLTALGLEYNEIGDAGLAALAACPYLANLTYLSLCGVTATDASVQQLQKVLPKCRIKR